MAPTDTTWTEDAIARLRELWDEGHSTAEIGQQLGVSKNAVVGKAHRLRLPPRPSPIRRADQPARASAPTSGTLPGIYIPQGPPVWAATARVAPLALAPDPLLPRRLALPQRCCWPLGEPGRAGFRFCDAAADAGKPYCPEHRALAYAKPSRPAAIRPSTVFVAAGSVVP